MVWNPVAVKILYLFGSTENEKYFFFQILAYICVFSGTDWSQTRILWALKCCSEVNHMVYRWIQKSTQINKGLAYENSNSDSYRVL